MIRIDALFFLLLLEALILMTALSFFLYRKMKKQRALGSSTPHPEGKEFAPSLHGLIETYLTNIKPPAAVGDVPDASPSGREIQALKMRFCSIVMDSAYQCEGSSAKFWDRLITGYCEIAEEMAAAKSELLGQITSAKKMTDNAPEAEVSVDRDDSETIDSLKEQIKRLVENVEAKTAQLTDLQARFDSLEKEYLVLYKESLK